MKKIFIGLISAIALVCAVCALCAPFSFYIVNPGITAIQLRMGRVAHVNNESGLYAKMPVVDQIIYLDTRVNKAPIETPAMSRDLQTVSVGMVVNYRIGNPLKLYEEIGTRFKEVIIDPFTQESVKAVIAKFTAEDLIQYRHEAKEKVIAELRERLAARHIILVDFNFIHLDFSEDFIKAVEQKQIAEQTAKQAKNLTEKIKEEALQTRTRAEAEAYAFKIKKESINEELIQLKKIEAQTKAIEKWNGVLPRVTGGTVPMLSISDQ